MKIVTVNIPESYIDAIEKLIGENGLYPSRSELIRCATRDFLKQELKQISKEEVLEEIQKRNKQNTDTVNVPVAERKDGAVEFKTYKIIKRLE
jgi:Arc/MetJ-type ribon-helix-helix transcriptional regulator